jgi:hypothetical protein
VYKIVDYKKMCLLGDDMNNLKVCDAVNWQIKLVGMKPKDGQIVKKCVARYTPGEGVSGKLKSLYYRVCDAVKNLLGKKTDWQLAEDAIERHIFSYAPSFCRPFAERNLTNHIHYVAGMALKFLVWENKNDVEIPESAKNLIQDAVKAGKAGAKVAAEVLLKRLNQYGSSVLSESIEVGKMLYEVATKGTKPCLQRSIRVLTNSSKKQAAGQQKPRFPQLPMSST